MHAITGRRPGLPDGHLHAHGFMAIIRTFWLAVCELFHVQYANAEEVHCTLRHTCSAQTAKIIDPN